MPDRTAAPATDEFSPALHESILRWYVSRGRHLAFRGTSDPYAVLVSEAMAQQTQAARAGESWSRFMDAFPTVRKLAAATPADVLRAWQGLGYNRRALNLWRAAGRIVDVHGGQVPADLDSLLELPGVGPYTARAVAAIAFGIPVGAVDTNVRRVLGRIVAGDAGILGAIVLQRIADAVVPTDQAAAWTHALMDLGATICGPRQPNCAACPAQAWCRYAANDPVGAGTTRSTRNPRDASSGSLRVRETPAPFIATSRWLRGRIVDRLRMAGDNDWTVFDGPIGSHDRATVAAALEALAHEGLVELDGTDGTDGPGAAGRRARLPLA